MRAVLRADPHAVQSVTVSTNGTASRLWEATHANSGSLKMSSGETDVEQEQEPTLLLRVEEAALRLGIGRMSRGATARWVALD